MFINERTGFDFEMVDHLLTLRKSLTLQNSEYGQRLSGFWRSFVMKFFNNKDSILASI